MVPPSNVTAALRDKIPNMYRGVPSSALASHWRREVLRTSLWFVPAIEVVVAIALFAVTLTADRAAYRGDFALPGWVISGSADAARQILTTVAAAIITVVGVVFSIILVTLTLASTQFGPRMLRNFIRDRGTQLTLGTFVATFVYSVLVLASIGTGIARGLRAAHRRDGHVRADGGRSGRAHLLHPPHGRLDPAAPGDREHRRRPGRGDQGAGQRESRSAPEGRPDRGRTR